MGITVVSTALNAAPYVKRCIRSVQHQTVRAKHYYIDAASTDATVQKATKFTYDPLVKVIAHSTRAPLIQNLLPVIYDLPDDEIVAWVDGDDWLATEYALERVQRAYDANDVMLTYGQFMWSNGAVGFAQRYQARPVREQPWYATHLKTFRAGLFKKIPITYLQDDERWFDLAVDQAIMLPMLELAGLDRARFIPEILYVYNAAHSFDSNATAYERDREHMTVHRIRARKPLARLA